MRHGSLESGIGGFDYAAEMVGWDNVFHCEINPFCQTVLNYYWPHAKSYSNVFGFNGYEWRGKVDIITGGLPCQPFSTAGKRKGSADDRHIWPENMRIVREAQPAVCVFENVPGILSIENGVVFEQVCVDLENEGYEVTPLIIPACSTDKDHVRKRIWIVAYCDRYGQRNFNGLSENTAAQGEGEGNGVQRQRLWSQLGGKDTNAANTMCLGQSRQGECRRSGDSAQNSYWEIDRTVYGNQLKESWLEAATRLCRVDDGFSGELDAVALFNKICKPRHARAFSKWRTESLKAYGNAIVWEVAYNIFQAIEHSI